jgi:1-acyl-sn-glycerol-3-phosphate acyltransferase
LVGGKRSFRKDAAWAVKHLVPPIQVNGQENIPTAGPCLITMNHYSRPGTQGFWLAMGVSAVVPVDIRWVMTAAWSYTGQKRGIIMRPIVRWFIGLISRSYGCLCLPSVPPVPGEEQERALAVRKVILAVRETPHLVLGLAAEGGDIPGGKLGWPPPGAGRFMLHLNRMGLPIVPVGINEENEVFCFRFGPAYQLTVSDGLSSEEQDKQAIRQVMGAIAGLLPQSMWGDFSPLINDDRNNSKTLIESARVN